MIALGDDVTGDASPAEGLAEYRLSGQHADRAGDGSRLSHDLVSGHGDVVTAGRGDVAHRCDDRLAARPRADNLPPDRVRGDIGAARAVDPQHDRARVLIP